ncbi:MAG: glycosyltransferase [Proteobacteria bacterium]|nr:glycosyltransferase [Pseudomonadota bacterium]
MRHEKTVLCFCKYPDPGVVKSRLAKELGREFAAAVYKVMLEHTVQTISLGNHELALHCFPDTQHTFFEYCSNKYHVPLYEQKGDDLGERMLHAIRSHLKHSHAVVLVGSDCPELGLDHINEAFHLLNTGSEIVLGPTRDGGYALIGVTRIDSLVFEGIPWSTGRVLSSTLNNIKALRWKSSCLPEVRDVDTFEDYQYYLNHDDHQQLFEIVHRNFQATG